MVGEGAYDVDGREQGSINACETKVVFTQGEFWSWKLFYYDHTGLLVPMLNVLLNNLQLFPIISRWTKIK